MREIGDLTAAMSTRIEPTAYQRAMLDLIESGADISFKDALWKWSRQSAKIEAKRELLIMVHTWLTRDNRVASHRSKQPFRRSQVAPN